MLHQTSTLASENPEGVGFVHKQHAIVFFYKIHKLHKPSQVPIDTKNCVRND
jgi:hypothetical protein